MTKQYRQIATFMGMILLCSHAGAQSFYGVRDNTSADWATGTTWDTGTTPVAGSNVYLIDGTDARINSAFDLGTGTLTLGNGGGESMLIIGAPLTGNYTATVGDQGWAQTSPINSISGGTWTINPGGAVYGSGSGSISGGNFTVNTGGIFATRYGDLAGTTITNNGGIVIDNDGANSGSATLHRDLALNFSNAINAGATLTIANGGKVKLGSVSNVITGGNFSLEPGGMLYTYSSGVGAVSGGTWDLDTGWMSLYAADSITGGTFNFNNGGTALASTNGSRAITGGTFNVDAFANFSFGTDEMVYGGDWIINGTFNNLGTSNQVLGSLSGSAAGTVNLGASVTVNQSTNTTYSGDFGAAGEFIKAGTGTLTLDGSNVFTGGTLRVNAGTLSLRNGYVINDGTNVVIDDGMLELFNYKTVWNIADAPIAGGTFSYADSGSTGYILVDALWAISGGTFNLAKTPGATLIEVQDDGRIGRGTYNLGAGIVDINNAAGLDGGHWNLGADTVLDMDYGGISALQEIDSLNGSGTVLADRTRLEIQGTQDSVFSGTITGTLSGTNNYIVKQGSSTDLTLNNPTGGAINASYFILVSGSLTLGADNQFQMQTRFRIQNATFNTGGHSENLGALDMYNTTTSTIDFSSAGTLSFQDSSAISWTGTLTFLNFDGTAKISFANQGLTQTQLDMITYDGVTARFDGATDYLTFEQILDYYAVINGSPSWATGTTWDTGSAPASGGNVYIQAGYDAVLGSAFNLGAGTLTVGNGVGTISKLTLNAALSGAHTATVGSRGWVQGNAAGAISSGTWTVNSGGLVTGDASGAITGGSFTVNSGGIFASRYGDLSGASITNNGGLVIDNDGANSGSATLANATITLSFANALRSGSTLTLSNGGVLTTSATSAVNGATITVNSGGQWNITGGTQTAGRISGAGTIALGGNALTVNQSANTSWTGVVSGSGTLTKSGSGTLTLNRTGGSVTGASTVAVSAGNLELGAANQINDSARLNMAGGTFATNGHSETLGTLKVSADSTIELGNSVHSLTFANSTAETWTGTLNIEGWAGDSNGGDQGRIYVASDGLTAGQRSQIQWAGGSIVGADFIAGNQLIPNLSSLSGTGTTLVMQLVEDGGVSLASPVSVPIPAQTIQTNGSNAYVNSVSETYPIEISDVRGTSSPLTVSVTVNPLANGAIVRPTTLSVDSLNGESAGVSSSSVTANSGSASGTLISATSTVNRAFGATVRVAAGALNGTSARSGTYSGSVVMTVN